MKTKVQPNAWQLRYSPYIAIIFAICAIVIAFRVPVFPAILATGIALGLLLFITFRIAIRRVSDLGILINVVVICACLFVTNHFAKDLNDNERTMLIAQLGFTMLSSWAMLLWIFRAQIQRDCDRQAAQQH